MRRVLLILITLQGVSMIVRGEEPEKVTVCQLKNDPVAFNHKLVEVTALISHGFEDFTLVADPDCTTKTGIWVDYGGPVRSNTIYCCGPVPKGKQVEEQDGIPLPLMKDDNFRAFDRIIRRDFTTFLRATLIGRFFSGDLPVPEGRFGPGFGHFGCCSLLVIQQVLSVDLQNRKDLDYRTSAHTPNVKSSCGVDTIHPQGYKWRTAQQAAENGQTPWAFDRPQRVAAGEIAEFLRIDPGTIAGLKQKHKEQGRFVYEWKPEGQKQTYQVVVSRPYFLTLYARDPKRIAWVTVDGWTWCN